LAYKKLSSDIPVEGALSEDAEELWPSSWERVVPFDRSAERTLGSIPRRLASSSRRDATFVPCVEDEEACVEVEEASALVLVDELELFEPAVIDDPLEPRAWPGWGEATPLAMSVAIEVSWSADRLGAPRGGLSASVWAIVETRVWLGTPA
jgi:hypothetical protein